MLVNRRQKVKNKFGLVGCWIRSVWSGAGWRLAVARARGGYVALVQANAWLARAEPIHQRTVDTAAAIT